MNGYEATAWSEASGWFERADRDLRAVRLCLAANDFLPDIAAYHCQQAAEKLIKGVLVLAGVSVRKTHDLDELADLAAPCFPAMASRLDAVRPLTDWAEAFRYPGIDPLVAPEPSRSALRKAVDVLELLHEEIKRLAPPK